MQGEKEPIRCLWCGAPWEEGGDGGRNAYATIYEGYLNLGRAQGLPTERGSPL